MPKNLGKKIYGPHKDQYRRRIRTPTGGWKDVLGRTGAELDRKEEELRASWQEEVRLAGDPYVYEYAGAWYKRTAPGLPESSRALHRYQINKVICPVIGKLQLSEVTLDDLKDVLAARPGRARSTQAKTVQTIRKIFSAAYEAGMIPRDPSARLQASGRKPEKRRALTPEQERTLLQAVRGLPVELFVELGLYTGLRREEICGLRWEDVSLDPPAPYIEVRRACRWPSNTQPVVGDFLKSDAAFRKVPIPPPLQEDLRRIRESLPGSASEIRRRYLICSREGGPISRQTLRLMWRSVEARSTGDAVRLRVDPVTGKKKKVTVTKELGDKIPKHTMTVTIDFPVSPHVLRHTYITRLVLGGMDLKRVQYLAGHASPEVTLQIYTDLMGQNPEDLIDDVSAIFPGEKNTPKKTPDGDMPPEKPSPAGVSPAPSA